MRQTLVYRKPPFAANDNDDPDMPTFNLMKKVFRHVMGEEYREWDGQ